MKALKDTQTAKNLMAAFAGESQARNRYTYFSSKAKNDGMVQISAVFAETAEQEKEHAKRLFKFMDGGEAEITAAFPFGSIGDTVDNLIGSAAGEHHEYAEMYPGFADVAQKEGFAEIAQVMRAIAIAEAWHEKRFLGFARNIKEGLVFKRAGVVKWRCRNCGCIHEGSEAPGLCPACAHPRDHFELLVEPWL